MYGNKPENLHYIPSFLVLIYVCLKRILPFFTIIFKFLHSKLSIEIICYFIDNFLKSIKQSRIEKSLCQQKAVW